MQEFKNSTFPLDKLLLNNREYICNQELCPFEVNGNYFRYKIYSNNISWQSLLKKSALYRLMLEIYRYKVGKKLMNAQYI